jgi:hypothetical protein
VDLPLSGRWDGGSGGSVPAPAVVSAPGGTVMEVKVAEMRREHPRWGSKPIRMELLRGPVAGVVLPSTATINRILTRPGLVALVLASGRGILLCAGSDGCDAAVGNGHRRRGDAGEPVTRELREAKVVTALDDRPPFCVSAKVVEHATSQAARTAENGPYRHVFTTLTSSCCRTQAELTTAAV